MANLCRKGLRNVKVTDYCDPISKFKLRWFTPDAERPQVVCTSNKGTLMMLLGEKSEQASKEFSKIVFQLLSLLGVLSLPSAVFSLSDLRNQAKMPVKYVVVDAFTNSAFKGNPAAVCLLEEEKSDYWLQAVAREFNISETCYLTRCHDLDSSIPYLSNSRFKLRWFTPVAEVKLCGHATLAAAHFCFTSGLVNAEKVVEVEKSDTLKCENGEVEPKFFIKLDFPVVPLTEYNSSDISSISKALGDAPVIDVKRTTTAEDLFVCSISIFSIELLPVYSIFCQAVNILRFADRVVLSSANAVTDVQPQMEKIQNCPGRGVIISGRAPSESGFDFFSRFFCPKFGINEDPVCGSAHCALVAYWAEKLGKHDFLAYAASPRGGVLKLHFDEKNSRVHLQGKAVTVMEGSLLV
ncbi:hypothetical protein Ancab_021910 [Ancistrocladus abbreviatus]